MRDNMKNQVNKEMIVKFSNNFDKVVEVVSDKYWDTLSDEVKEMWSTIDTFDFTIKYLQNNECNIGWDDSLYRMWGYISKDGEVDVESTLDSMFFGEEPSEERVSKIVSWVNNLNDFVENLTIS